MTREELINSKEYKVVNAAFDWMEEHQDADLLDAFEAGDEWGNKQAVDKACEWLWNCGYIDTLVIDDVIDKFKKYMEEQQ